MTVFAMEFNVDNAAFQRHDPDTGEERLDEYAVGALVEQVGYNLRAGKLEGTIHDVNGNTVGSYGIVP